MKFVVIGAGAAASVAFCASSASAGDWYVSGALGAVFRDPSNTMIDQPTDPFGNRVSVGGQPVPYRVSEHTDFKPGFEADVALGRRFTLGRYGALRAEAELSYRDYQVGSSTVTSLPSSVYDTTVNASLKTTSGLHELRWAQTANLFYDFALFHGFTPYVGGGVGYQEGVQTSGDRLRTATVVSGGVQANPVTTVHQDSTNQDDGTWLVEAGVAAPLTPRLSIAPAYRFTQSFDGRKPINVARVALRYNF
jgi:opacity protein-like surface antigen